MRRLAFVASLVCTVIGVQLVLAAAGASAAARVTVDQPDEQVGPQIHLVYAIPSGGVDSGLDVNGTIDRWVATFNDWLASQTGGVRLRIDTAGGAADVTFVQLNESDAEIQSMGMAGTVQIENEISADGLSDPFKKYLIVYGGADNFGFCGNAIGSGSVVYLESCNVSDWLAMLIGHEMFHLLGAVDPCAPHYGAFGETVDNGDDLMGFDVPSQATAVLDPGHDDYWGPPGDNHLPANCPASANVANSDYLTSHPFFTVQVNSGAGGAVVFDPAGTSSGFCTPSDPCSTFFAAGTSVTVSPLPDPGYHFVRWDGGNCATQAFCTLVVGAASDVSAVFAVDPYLRIKIKGAGRVRVPGLQQTCSKSSCRYQISYNTPTQLIAVPKPGTHFAGWTGPCNTKRTKCRLNLTANSTIAAKFAPNRPPKHR
jgi:Divergent InlB B-repeat domain